jgi:hypothetical protein
MVASTLILGSKMPVEHMSIIYGNDRQFEHFLNLYKCRGVVVVINLLNK